MNLLKILLFIKNIQDVIIANISILCLVINVLFHKEPNLKDKEIIRIQ